MAFDLDKLERQAVELDAELAAKRFSVPKIPPVGTTVELSGCQTGGIPAPVKTSSLSPPISTPLNVAKFKADPCSVVTVEQLEAIGILGGKPLSEKPEHCTFTGLPKPDVFIYRNVQLDASMESLYYSHINGKFVGNHWEELTIKEYPAVIIDVDQKAPDESAGTQACTLNLGADAKTIIAIHVNTYVNDTGRWKDRRGCEGHLEGL